MNKSKEELRLFNSLGTDHLPKDVRERSINLLCQSLPESLQGKIDSGVVKDSLEDYHIHERRLVNHIIQYYQSHCALGAKVASVYYKAEKINIQIKKINDDEIAIYIPEKWTYFFRNILVLLSTIHENWNDRKQVGNAYKALLVYIDAIYYRGQLASIDAGETVDESIRVIEGHFNEVSDLLFSIFAFAICHELSHIVLKHDKQNVSIIEREIEADTHAYIMFLKLIQNYLRGNDQEIAITECFQHYVANAPQILLRLYATIHSYLSIVYEEKYSQEYPDFILREKTLFDMQKNMPTKKWFSLCEKIDTTILFNQDAIKFYNEFQKPCEFFVEQTTLKKQRGKLDVLKTIDSGE